ncbi:MAG: DUF5107 domain-containing protein [Chitinophagaceae bacterium]
MLFRSSLCAIFLLICCFGFSQNKATIKEYKKTFTTYPYSDPDPVPDFSKIYPYYRFDGFTEKSIQKEWKVVELENDFIKVMILPEIGGKIWAAIEKSTNQPFIYYNHVVKFRDVAMRGPWTSGGIEANYGIIGHTPNSASPVDYALKQKEDGSVSCYIGWLDLLTRTNWCIEINLPADKAFFTTHSTWYNNTPLEQPYYHWMNVGIKTKGNLQFIYPGTKYIGHEGEYADWPVNKSNGKHIDFYEQNNFGGYKSYHVFGKYTDFFGAYWHDDDYGMARYATHDEKAGKKIWIWGLSQQGMIWEKLLTDNDGQYAEIQSGRLFNQNAEGSTLTPFKHVSFEPYATDEWTEYWYPVLKTKGFVKANEYGALNVIVDNGMIKIYFSPVRELNDQLTIRQNGKTIYDKKVHFSPLKVFADSIAINDLQRDFIVSIGENKLVYNSSIQADDLNRPVDAPKDFDWNSAYGNYLAGKELMDQRLYARAEEKLSKSIALDGNFIPSLNKMAELCYHNMQYDKALALSKKALSIDTHDGASNYYYGLINEQLGNSTDAKDGFDLATLSASYRDAAYTALARIYLGEKNYERALSYADKALFYNAGNVSAYKTKAIVYRKLQQKKEADEVWVILEKINPLNHFSSFEKYLWSKDEKDKKDFISEIQNEQPYQSFLELAMDYYNAGCYDDALKTLELSPSHTLISYWKGYLNSKLGNAGKEFIAEGSKSPIAFVMPFRAESLQMLQWVTSQTDDWKPRYYLALLYNSTNNVEESRNLMNAIGDLPKESSFYATRAAMDSEDAKKEKDLLKAYELDKEQWRYTKKLAEFYLTKQDDTKALSFTESFYKSHTDNYIIGLLYAKCLLQNKRYADASSLLSGLHIIPFEGATEGRELYRLLMLNQAIQSIRDNKYKKAFGFLAKAKLFPENLGSGKPYDEDIDYRAEYYLAAICSEKMRNKEAADKMYKGVAGWQSKSLGYRANIILQAWALRRSGDETAANELIEKTVNTAKKSGNAPFIRDLYEKRPISDSKIADGNSLLIEEIGGLQ